MTESKLTVRRAAPRDLPRLHELLRQVAEVHHQGRPDLFKAGQRKYTDEQLLEKISADSLGFLDVNTLEQIAPNSKVHFCKGCFTGVYPSRPPERAKKNIFE